MTKFLSSVLPLIGLALHRDLHGARARNRELEADVRFAENEKRAWEMRHRKLMDESARQQAELVLKHERHLNEVTSAARMTRQIGENGERLIQAVVRY